MEALERRLTGRGHQPSPSLPYDDTTQQQTPPSTPRMRSAAGHPNRISQLSAMYMNGVVGSSSSSDSVDEGAAAAGDEVPVNGPRGVRPESPTLGRQHQFTRTGSLRDRVRAHEERARAAAATAAASMSRTPASPRRSSQSFSSPAVSPNPSSDSRPRTPSYLSRVPNHHSSSSISRTRPLVKDASSATVWIPHEVDGFVQGTLISSDDVLAEVEVDGNVSTRLRNYMEKDVSDHQLAAHRDLQWRRNTSSLPTQLASLWWTTLHP
jgi:hypothetical protein